MSRDPDENRDPGENHGSIGNPAPEHWRGQDPATLRFSGLNQFEQQHDRDFSLSTEDHATIDALRPGTALLLVLRGPNTGARFLLDAPLTTTGRHPDSDIFLDDVTVSRKHAVFEQEGEGFTVRDVGSLNGTYVNRERIDSVTLRPGDEVQIGKYRLVFYSSTTNPA